MKALIACVLLTASCASTAHLDDTQPVATFQSAKSRAVIAECLLDRLGGSGIVPERTDEASVTTVRITSADQWTNPALYLFTIRDNGSGSVVEARMPRGFAKRALPAAESCL